MFLVFLNKKIGLSVYSSEAGIIFDLDIDGRTLTLFDFKATCFNVFVLIIVVSSEIIFSICMFSVIVVSVWLFVLI